MTYYDIERLKKAGYKVFEKSPWHYQVTQGKTTLNYWPTKRKYMIEFGSGASYYDDILEVTVKILGAAGERRSRDPRWLVKQLAVEEEAMMTPERREAIEAHKEDLILLRLMLPSQRRRTLRILENRAKAKNI